MNLSRRVLATIETTTREVSEQAAESRELVSASSTVIDTIVQTSQLMEEAADVVNHTATSAESIRPTSKPWAASWSRSTTPCRTTTVRPSRCATRPMNWDRCRACLTRHCRAFGCKSARAWSAPGGDVAAPLPSWGYSSSRATTSNKLATLSSTPAIHYCRHAAPWPDPLVEMVLMRSICGRFAGSAPVLACATLPISVVVSDVLAPVCAPHRPRWQSPDRSHPHAQPQWQHSATANWSGWRYSLDGGDNVIDAVDLRVSRALTAVASLA